jgi:hypothetical protein
MTDLNNETQTNKRFQISIDICEVESRYGHASTEVFLSETMNGMITDNCEDFDEVSDWVHNEFARSRCDACDITFSVLDLETNEYW